MTRQELIEKMKNKVCWHKDKTIIEFENHNNGKFTLSFCHKCETVIVSTTYSEIVPLAKFKDLWKQIAKGDSKS